MDAAAAAANATGDALAVVPRAERAEVKLEESCRAAYDPRLGLAQAITIHMLCAIDAVSETTDG